MRTQSARLVIAIIVAATGVYFGAKLAAYAEADDAPGGVMIAAVLIVGSLAFGVWIALRGARKAAPKVKGE